MRHRLVAIGAAVAATTLALLLAVVVNLGVLRAIGNPSGPGHLNATTFTAPPSGGVSSAPLALPSRLDDGRDD
jgi:hypothetical protein